MIATDGATTRIGRNGDISRHGNSLDVGATILTLSAYRNIAVNANVDGSPIERRRQSSSCAPTITGTGSARFSQRHA